MFFPIRTFILVIIFSGFIVLQVFLSKTESKWPGLVLPITAFIISFTLPLNMMVPAEGVTAGLILQMISVWLLGNIPTVMLLAIYFVCRDKYRRKKQLDKMNINDLA